MPDINTQEITMYEGESKIYPHTWVEKATGNPIDLTGSTIEFDCNDASFNKTAVITDEVNGKYNLVLAESDTLGKVSTGGQLTIKYIVKHISSGGEIRYIYKLNIKVIGVDDD